MLWVIIVFEMNYRLSCFVIIFDMEPLLLEINGKMTLFTYTSQHPLMNRKSPYYMTSFRLVVIDYLHQEMLYWQVPPHNALPNTANATIESASNNGNPPVGLQSVQCSANRKSNWTVSSGCATAMVRSHCAILENEQHCIYQASHGKYLPLQIHRRRFKFLCSGHILLLFC